MDNAIENTPHKSTWIRSDEMDLADELAKRNLTHADTILPKVHPKRSFYSVVVKRAIDVVVSVLAVVVTFPINVVLAILTRFDVGSPILYKQQRIGRGGKPFTLVKFRNMTNEKDEKGELLPPSQRVTRMGKTVRKYSLDELLNFVSILKGDMSIIGPRPMPLEYLPRMSNRHRQRHAVRPGLLCPLTEEILAKYPNPKPYSRYQTQFENDVWYVENISFRTDMKLFVGLVKATFDMARRTKNASSASPFIGYDKNGYAVSRKHLEKFDD